MINPTLLILAAGEGSRYGATKLSDPIGPNGEKMIDYSIYDAHRAGFGRIVFVIRVDMEKSFKAAVHERHGMHGDIEFVFQKPARLPAGFNVPPGRTRPWGTTHAVLAAQGFIKEPFAVINADDFYGADSYVAMADHLKSGSGHYAMAGFVLRNTLSEFEPVSRAICQVGPDGYLQKIVELKSVERVGGHAVSTNVEGHETRLVGNEIVCMNMWGFTPAIFPDLEQRFRCFMEKHGADLHAESYISVAINELLLEGRVRIKVLNCVDPWFGVADRGDQTHAAARLRHLVATGIYPRRLTAEPTNQSHTISMFAAADEARGRIHTKKSRLTP